MIDIKQLREAGKLYAGKSVPAYSMFSPSFANLAELPAMPIHIGEHERMLNDSVLFSNRAAASG